MNGEFAKWHTIAQLADSGWIGKRLLYKAIESHALRASLVGNKFMVHDDDLAEWLRSLRVAERPR